MRSFQLALPHITGTLGTTPLRGKTTFPFEDVGCPPCRDSQVLHR